MLPFGEFKKAMSPFQGYCDFGNLYLWLILAIQEFNTQAKLFPQGDLRGLTTYINRLNN